MTPKRPAPPPERPRVIPADLEARIEALPEPRRTMVIKALAILVANATHGPRPNRGATR